MAAEPSLSQSAFSILRMLMMLPIVLVMLREAINLATRPTYLVHDDGAIVVTGASTGIGRHAAVNIAKNFAGYTVYAGVRKDSDADSIKGEGLQNLKPVILDVTKQDSIDKVFEDIKGEKLVALVNNAGISEQAPVEVMNIDNAKWCFDVNYWGTIRATKTFLPLLRKTGNGARIVMISSVAGLMSSAGGNPYSATKFSMESLSDALRIELAKWKISVSVVNPAFVTTEIFDKAKSNKKEQKRSMTEEQLELYSHIINDEQDQKMNDFVQKASPPSVTTNAIIHSITEPNPEVRYVVANVDGTAASVYVWLKQWLPERAWDKMVVSVMGIKE